MSPMIQFPVIGASNVVGPTVYNGKVNNGATAGSTLCHCYSATFVQLLCNAMLQLLYKGPLFAIRIII